MTCPKCNRAHSGICGIPGRGTMRSPGLARPTASSRFEIHQQIKARKKSGSMERAPVLTTEQEAALKSARGNLSKHLDIFRGLTEGEVGYEDAFMAVEGWLDEIANLVTGNTTKEQTDD